MAVYRVVARRKQERGAFDLSKKLSRLAETKRATVEADSPGEAFTRARIAFPSSKGWTVKIHGPRAE